MVRLKGQKIGAIELVSLGDGARVLTGQARDNFVHVNLDSIGWTAKLQLVTAKVLDIRYIVMYQAALDLLFIFLTIVQLHIAVRGQGGSITVHSQQSTVRQAVRYPAVVEHRFDIGEASAKFILSRMRLTFVYKRLSHEISTYAHKKQAAQQLSQVNKDIERCGASVGRSHQILVKQHLTRGVGAQQAMHRLGNVVGRPTLGEDRMSGLLL